MEFQDRMWLAFAREFVTEAEGRAAMLVAGKPGDRGAVRHFFHDGDDGSLLQVIARPGIPGMAEINLYDANGGSYPIAGLSTIPGEVTVTTRGIEYRMLADGPGAELFAFVSRVTANALASETA